MTRPMLGFKSFWSAAIGPSGAAERAKDSRGRCRAAPCRQCGGGPQDADTTVCQRARKVPRKAWRSPWRHVRGVRSRSIDSEEGSHGPLLQSKRLLEPGRAWPLAQARSRDGHSGYKRDPGSGPTQESGSNRRQAPTVAFRGLGSRSLTHVIPYWLPRSGRNRGRHRFKPRKPRNPAGAAIYPSRVYGQGSCRHQTKKKRSC
jgi:hypothetical protein